MFGMDLSMPPAVELRRSRALPRIAVTPDDCARAAVPPVPAALLRGGLGFASGGDALGEAAQDAQVGVDIDEALHATAGAGARHDDKRGGKAVALAPVVAVLK